MEITITDVTGLQLSAIEEYGLDEEDIAAGENPYYRVITIETPEGTLKIELEAMSQKALRTSSD